MIPSSVMDWFTPPAVLKETIGARSRAEVVIYASAIMAAPGPFFAAAFVKQDMLFMSIVCWVATALMVAAPFLMRFTKSIDLAVHVLCGAFVLVALGGSIVLDRSLSPVWPTWVVIPALAWIMAEGVARWLWTAVCVASLLVFTALEILIPLESTTLPMFARSWLVCAVTITCIGINVLVIFVFDRKKNEARQVAEDAQFAFADSERRLLTVLRNAPIALWSFDREGNSLLQEGIAGQLFDERVLPLFDENVETALRGEAVLSQLSWEGREYETEFVPIIDESGVSGVIGVAADVTDRERLLQIKQLNDELRTARDAAISGNRAKSMFLANMSHELRTPLNAIIGYSELLLEDAIEHEQRELAADLTRIHGSGRHLLALISDVLDLSKIEEGKIVLRYAKCPLPELLNDLYDTLRPLAQKNGNALTFVADNAPAMMDTDDTRLRQILLNILANACKFTSDGEVTLEVDAYQEEDGAAWISFLVRDTGIGIPFEQQQSIFEVFSQVERKTNKTHGGSGLGLALSQRLVHNMGGTIEVSSREGEGASFTVRLPQHHTTPEEPSAPMAI